MRPEAGDLAYVWDMREAALEAIEFVAGCDYSGFSVDLRLRRAVERELEIIGEAASHISPPFRQAHADIPWAGIIGQRNVLAHEYGDIQLDRIWRVATQRLPELVDALTQLLPAR